MTDHLSVSRAYEVIDAVLADSSPAVPAQRIINDGSSMTTSKLSIPYYFGFTVKNSPHDAADIDGGLAKTNTSSLTVNTINDGFCTFYLAYSTWDGRMLYVDRLSLPDIDHEKKNDIAINIYKLLATIACQLGCARLSWTQRDKPDDTFSGHVPEFCEEWLFLKMDRRAMEAYVGDSSLSVTSPSATTMCLDRATVERAIQSSLKEGLNSRENSNVFLRLASEEDDMNKIGELVQGLAVYEKEPYAVNVTPQDYLRDSKKSTDPLFYCLLADFTCTDVGGDDNDTGTTSKRTTTTCGMGFFFLGYEHGQGPFIYLEDLYIDSRARGRGGGKLLMKELARIALKLGCVKLTWSALDWNINALNFYKKIGAAIEDDKKLTRFCGQNLIRFADGGTGR